MYIKYFKHCSSKRSHYWSIFLQILKELWYRVIAHDVLERSYAVAFNFTLAIFPATIFIFTLIPYIPIPELVPKLINLFKEGIPETIYGALAPTIQDTLSKHRSGLLSFGFIYSLYLSSNGMMSLMKNFNLVDQSSSQYKRSYLHQRAVATILTLVLTSALFISILLLIIARQVLDYMVSYELITYKSHISILSPISSIVVLLVFFIAIAGIYYLSPTNRQNRKFILVGSLIATLGCFLASLAFSYYVNHFVKYGLYGSLGVMIALMLWLFLLSLILLIGFELNITLNKILGPSKQQN
jgi:membrane protein